VSDERLKAALELMLKLNQSLNSVEALFERQVSEEVLAESFEKTWAFVVEYHSRFE
jgi:hypothetical protein